MPFPGNTARLRSSPSGLVTLAIALLLGACTSRPNDSSPIAGSEAGVGVASGNASAKVRDRGETAPASASDRPDVRRDRCTVQTVTDGDSFRCTDGRRVRLLLLDAPEMSQTPFGQRSRDALRARMPRGGTVWLEYDVQRLDRYDRTLAYVWTQQDGGELINVLQARGGWAVAVVFPPNVRHIDEVRRAVADARSANRGLWAEGGFTCEPIDRKRGRC